jgi:8-oxo-dGTP pyrophosphatase MutT (NUDIX family)
MNKSTAVLIFIDSEGNILLQERGYYSKTGEKHGYFGGNIEKGEKPKDCLIRELKEEIDYIPPRIRFWKKIEFLCTAEGKCKNQVVAVYIFVSPLTKEAEEVRVYEGEGVIKTTLNKELESENITGGYEIVLKEIKNHLAEVIRMKGS